MHTDIPKHFRMWRTQWSSFFQWPFDHPNGGHLTPGKGHLKHPGSEVKPHLLREIWNPHTLSFTSYCRGSFIPDMATATARPPRGPWEAEHFPYPFVLVIMHCVCCSLMALVLRYCQPSLFPATWFLSRKLVDENGGKDFRRCGPLGDVAEKQKKVVSVWCFFFLCGAMAWVQFIDGSIARNFFFCRFQVFRHLKHSICGVGAIGCYAAFLLPRNWSTGQVNLLQ